MEERFKDIADSATNSLDNFYNWLEVVTESMPYITAYFGFMRIVIDLLTVVLFICAISFCISGIKYFNRH